MTHRYTVLRAWGGRHYWRYSWQRSCYLMGRSQVGTLAWRRLWRHSPTWKEPHTPLPPPPAWLKELQTDN